MRERARHTKIVYLWLELPTFDDLSEDGKVMLFELEGDVLFVHGTGTDRNEPYIGM